MDAVVNSPTLVAARERLLAGIMATWPKPRSRSKPVAPAPDPLTAELAALERLGATWRDERMKLNAIVADSVNSHTSPPNNYWVAERRAYQKLLVAAAVVAVLHDDAGADLRPA